MSDVSTDFTLIQTERLVLVSWTVPLIDALIAEHAEVAERILNAKFPVPYAPPPETGDALGFFRKATAADTSNGLLVSRMIVRKADRVVVGSIGAMAPDDTGASMIGYSVYPEFERNGYASEAARGLVDFVIRYSAVESIFATIEIGNIASERVASRAGLVVSGEIRHEEGLDLNVWRRRR